MQIDLMTAFFNQLKFLALKDKNIFFITADHGAWALSDFKKNLENQYLNIGISEQAMASIAAGMALEGKKVFIFSITPFVTQRCFEQIKLDICLGNLPVTIVGNGSSLTYAPHGPSHQAIEDIAIMRSLPNMKIIHPYDNTSSKYSVNYAYKAKSPVYIKLDKGYFENIFLKPGDNIIKLNKKNSKKTLVITTGVIVHAVYRIIQELNKDNYNIDLFNMFSIKETNSKILKYLKQYDKIITIEEQNLLGGIGSIISEIIADNNINVRLKRFGIGDKYILKCGNRNWLRKKYGLDDQTLYKNIKNFCDKKKFI
jgi:transketolase